MVDQSKNIPAGRMESPLKERDRGERGLWDEWNALLTDCTFILNIRGTVLTYSIDVTAWLVVARWLTVTERQI